MSTTSTTSIDDLEDPEANAVWKEVPRSRSLRRTMRLSIEQFSERYRIPVETLRAWEAGTSTPDAVADTLLRLIAREPEAVAKALAPREPRRQAEGKREAAE